MNPNQWLKFASSLPIATTPVCDVQNVRAQQAFAAVPLAIAVVPEGNSLTADFVFLFNRQSSGELSPASLLLSPPPIMLTYSP